MMLLKLCLSLLMASAVVAQESLVITAMVDAHDFDFLELRACTDIADLSLYTFSEYINAHTAADCTYTLKQLINIPAGTFIYFGNGSPSTVQNFFGYMPSNYFPTYTCDLAGWATFVLKHQSTIVDIYGVVGVDTEHTIADYGKGWARRGSGIPATPTFNVFNWMVHANLFPTSAETNTAATPPIKLGQYQCPSVSTPAPSQQPTLRPTLAGRNRTKDEVGDHHRSPTETRPGTEVVPTTPPSAAPIPPLGKPNPNPPRACPSGEKAVYVSGRAKCQAPTCKDDNGVSYGTPFAKRGCGCGCVLF